MSGGNKQHYNELNKKKGHHTRTYLTWSGRKTQWLVKTVGVAVRNANPHSLTGLNYSSLCAASQGRKIQPLFILIGLIFIAM